MLSRDDKDLLEMKITAILNELEKSGFNYKDADNRTLTGFWRHQTSGIGINGMWNTEFSRTSHPQQIITMAKNFIIKGGVNQEEKLKQHIDSAMTQLDNLSTSYKAEEETIEMTKMLDLLREIKKNQTIMMDKVEMQSVKLMQSIYATKMELKREIRSNVPIVSESLHTKNQLNQINQKINEISNTITENMAQKDVATKKHKASKFF